VGGDAENYHRVVTDRPIWWPEDVCAENNAHVAIGKDSYYLSADGLLMPAKKNQAHRICDIPRNMPDSACM